MKKSLIALAALSAFATAAQAQSSVTVYGVMDIGYQSSDYTASLVTGTADSTALAATKTTAKGMGGDGALSTSVIGFRGSEDLGGGMKANFHLEYDLLNAASQQSGYSDGSAQFGANTSADMGTKLTGDNSKNGAFGARLSWIGLSDAKLGEIRLGRQFEVIHGVITANLAAGANNTVGSSYYSAGPLKAGDEISTRVHAVFVNNAYTYISPNLNGLTVSAQTAKNEYKVGDGTTTGHKASTNGLAANYKFGKLDVSVGSQTTKYDADYDAATNDIKRKVDAFGANYDFGVVRVFASNQKVTQQNAGVDAIERNFNEAGVRVPQGKFMFHASMFTGTNKTVGGTATGLIEHDVDGYQVGAQYSLSKRTTAYALMGQTKQTLKTISTVANTYAATDVNNAKVKQMAIGLRHSF